MAQLSAWSLSALVQRRSQTWIQFAHGVLPNNSFKPSPLRGLGAGAMIEPSPRPLSRPA